MKIAVTATGPGLDAQVDARFGRCAYFLLVDTETMDVEAIENPNIVSGGGAGIQSASLMAEKGVQVALTGNCGPNAFQVFGAAGIQVIVGVSGVIRDVVKNYREGAFTAAAQPNVASHFGSGVGTGRGSGVGRGSGMGRGGGMGSGSFPPATNNAQHEASTSPLVAQVDTEKCTGCAACISFCPEDAISVNAVAHIDIKTCTGCAQCIAKCPQFALSLHKR